MAITSAICNSFKQEILEAEHNFTASSGNTFNLALYDSDATLNKSTTAYTTSEELADSGGYTAKGNALTSVTPVLDSLPRRRRLRHKRHERAWILARPGNKGRLDSNDPLCYLPLVCVRRREHFFGRELV